MQIPGENVKAILQKHGYATNPDEPFQPSIVEEEGDQLYVDVNSFVVRYGVKQDQMPDHPVRIFLKTKNSAVGTVGLDVIEVREVTADEKTKAEARGDLYPKVAPWPEKRSPRPE
jgi:hypothetical protein